MPPHEMKEVILAFMACVSGLTVTGIAAWTVVRLRQPRGGRAALGDAALQERLSRVEQALDAMTLELERSGEAQRFTARLLAERLGEPSRGAERALAPHRPAITPH